MWCGSIKLQSKLLPALVVHHQQQLLAHCSSADFIPFSVWIDNQVLTPLLLNSQHSVTFIWPSLLQWGRRWMCTRDRTQHCVTASLASLPLHYCASCPWTQPTPGQLKNDAATTWPHRPEQFVCCITQLTTFIDWAFPVTASYTERTYGAFWGQRATVSIVIAQCRRGFHRNI